MCFLNTDTVAEVTAVSPTAGSRCASVSYHTNGQQGVAFDGCCVKNRGGSSAAASLREKGSRLRWNQCKLRCNFISTPDIAGISSSKSPVQTENCAQELSAQMGRGWQKTTKQQSRTHNWRWSVRHVKDWADTDILPGVTLDLYPFTWTSTENWSWRSARRSGSGRNRSGCPFSSPACHPHHLHPGRTLTDLHLHRPLRHHPAGGGVFIFRILPTFAPQFAELNLQRRPLLLHPVCIWRGRHPPRPHLPPPPPVVVVVVVLLLLSYRHL